MSGAATTAATAGSFMTFIVQPGWLLVFVGQRNDGQMNRRGAHPAATGIILPRLLDCEGRGC